LGNTFTEIICWDNDCLVKSIAIENRSRFDISLSLEIVIFISNLGNYQESSYCKKVIRTYLLMGILYIFQNFMFLCSVSSI